MRVFFRLCITCLNFTVTLEATKVVRGERNLPVGVGNLFWVK